MNEKMCPLCGGAMVRGRAAIKKSRLAWLAWPFERDRLEFVADHAPGITEIVARQDTDYEAFKCVQCGALLLTQNKWGA
jgi:hypothetical protein